MSQAYRRSRWLLRQRLMLRKPTKVCARLIEARADVSAVDDAGLTALGHMWKAFRDARDFMACHGVDCVSVNDVDVLEKLLMPPSGPTAADELMQELSEEEVEEEDDFDDDDEVNFWKVHAAKK